ncbi:hypothetical protein [Streptomyces sp. NPDC018584]|uniref:hypothetical protein n=1 Tax=unclassified Streptomyces TaxID=2593676 RepID=UPI003795670C
MAAAEGLTGRRARQPPATTRLNAARLARRQAVHQLDAWGFPHGSDGDAESGRGLCLVAALDAAWGVVEREVGKTVGAEPKV